MQGQDMKVRKAYINSSSIEIVKHNGEYLAAVGHILELLGQYAGNTKYAMDQLGGKAYLLSISRSKYYTDADGVLLLVKQYGVDNQLVELAKGMHNDDLEKFYSPVPSVCLSKKKKKKKGKRKKVKPGQLLMIESDGKERIFEMMEIK